jgi:hypothetical protein
MGNKNILYIKRAFHCSAQRFSKHLHSIKFSVSYIQCAHRNAALLATGPLFLPDVNKNSSKWTVLNETTRYQIEFVQRFQNCYMRTLTLI